MVYIFGFDFPLVESLLVVSFFLVLMLIALIFVFVRIIQMNRKLDELLDEEKLVKIDLEKTRDEETRQLDIIKKELEHLEKIGRDETDQLNYIKDIIRTLSAAKGGKFQLEYVKNIADKLKELDKIAKDEDRQLMFIKDMLTRLKSKE